MCVERPHSFFPSFIHAFIHSFIRHSSLFLLGPALGYLKMRRTTKLSTDLIHFFMHSFIHAFIHVFFHSSIIFTLVRSRPGLSEDEADDEDAEDQTVFDRTVLLDSKRAKSFQAAGKDPTCKIVGTGMMIGENELMSK